MSSLEQAQVRLRIRVADDHLVLGHRLSQWCGHAPMLEEELALANIGLDLLGQARALYAAAGTLEGSLGGSGRNEDEIAYLRVDREYQNLLLVERPNGDFARTMVRQLFFSVFQQAWWEAAAGCADETLADIARKAVTESKYHVRHAAEWVIRLGDGTDESHARAAAAVEHLAPYAAEMFDDDASARALVESQLAPDAAALAEPWRREIDAILGRATLTFPPQTFALRGGRDGRHGEEFGFLLAELQYMQRTYPGQTW